jgi:hypothetical protein
LRPHLVLSSSQDFVVSCVVNSFDFWQVARDARLYWPLRDEDRVDEEGRKRATTSGFRLHAFLINRILIVEALDLARAERELDAAQKRRMGISLEFGMDQIRNLAGMPVQIDSIFRVTACGRGSTKWGALPMIGGSHARRASRQDSSQWLLILFFANLPESLSSKPISAEMTGRRSKRCADGRLQPAVGGTRSYRKTQTGNICMQPVTSEQWLAKLAYLNVDCARGDAAPHKPLLLLVLIELAEQGCLPNKNVPLTRSWRFASSLTGASSRTAEARSQISAIRSTTCKVTAAGPRSRKRTARA